MVCVSFPGYFIYVGQQRRDERKDGDAATPRSIFFFMIGGNFEASFKALTKNTLDGLSVVVKFAHL